MFFENVKRLCAERGISFMRLEKELGFGHGAVGKWAKNSPSVNKAAKVAAFFGVTVDELLKEGKIDGSS